jgi:hypothetical protein
MTSLESDRKYLGFFEGVLLQIKGLAQNFGRPKFWVVACYFDAPASRQAVYRWVMRVHLWRLKARFMAGMWWGNGLGELAILEV